MNLLYIWVKDFHCFNNAEMNFTGLKQFHFDFSTFQLMQKNKSSSSLYAMKEESCIDNVSIIVGSNGSGKTSILDLLYYSCFCLGDTSDYIIIYENNTKLYCYSNILDKIITEIVFEDNRYSDLFNIIYYSPLYIKDYKLETYAGGIDVLFKSMSTSSLIEEDITNYQNPRLDIDYSKTYKLDKITAHEILDNERLISFLSRLNDIDQSQFQIGITLPEKIICSPDYNQYLKFKAECKNEQLITVLDGIKSKICKTIDKETFIVNFLFLMLCNFTTTHLLSERVGIEQDIIEELLLNVETGYSKESVTVYDSLYNIFTELAFPSKKTGKLEWTIDNSKARMRLKLISFLQALDDHYFSSQFLVFDLKKDYENIQVFYDLYKRIEGTTGFCSFDKYPHISAGEESVLLLYARIMDGIKQFKEDSINKSVLLFLDETEITLHPKLQQHLIKNLIYFLNFFYKEHGYRFHIIFATHSPIILSDVPNDNVVFLKKIEGSRYSEVIENHKQTFASNIYQLFNDSFFLETMPIGDYARELINSAINDINECYDDPNKEVSEQTELIVNMIGDSVFKNILKERMQK